MKSKMISVKQVTPLTNFMLDIVFNNNERKIFDAKPYLNLGVFKQLKQDNLFMSAKVMNRTVTWCEGEIDIAPNTLYAEGITQ
jgi:Protein of unknown function (DUF2442)